ELAAVGGVVGPLAGGGDLGAVVDRGGASDPGREPDLARQVDPQNAVARALVVIDGARDLALQAQLGRGRLAPVGGEGPRSWGLAGLHAWAQHRRSPRPGSSGIVLARSARALDRPQARADRHHSRGDPVVGSGPRFEDPGTERRRSCWKVRGTADT